MVRRTLLLFVAVALAASCGKNNNFQATDTPEFQLEGPGFIELVLPREDIESRSQQELVIRNRGDGPMTVQSLEWIDKPDRLLAFGERGDACETDDECDGGVCLSPANICVKTGLPETPLTVEPQGGQALNFVITRGPSEIDCPEPGEDTPIDYQNRYCGALRIATNADNDFGDTIVDGEAVIYFLASGASGDIEVEPSFIEFTNVQPGTTQSQTFAITNAGMNDLQITTMGVEDNQLFFDFNQVEGENLPVTIDSGRSKTWEVVVTIPEGTTDYETFTTLNIESSAGLSKVAIQITADAGSSPVIELSDTVLKFDAAASQTVTVRNTGQATLALQGLNIRPATARPFYTFSIDGNDVTNNFQNVNIPMGQSKDIVVDFARPMDNTDSSVGVLEISHNDRNRGFVSEVTLLGDEGDVPIGSLHPSVFTFQAEDGNSDTRSFVIRNAGTAALDITGLTWGMFGQGSNAEFQVSPTSGSVPAGGILSGTVTFTGGNATPDVGTAVLDSNSNQPLEISLRALNSATEQPVPVITVTNQGALVAGSTVNLSAADSTPDGVETNAIWTLVSRPASSTVFLDAVGDSTSFLPDVAGTYTIALTILSGDREGQATMDIVVE